MQGILGSGTTTATLMAKTTTCTGFTWDGQSSTDGTASCILHTGVIATPATSGTNALDGCYTRKLSTASDTFSKIINAEASATAGQIPRVSLSANFGYTPATVAGTIGKYGTEVASGSGTTAILTSSGAIAANSFDFFQYTLEQWSGAYANLIDAEATFKVADWYFQKLSLMYGYDTSEYGALADGNYTKYGNIYETNINVSYILGPKTSAGLTQRNPSLENITLLELTG